MNNYIQYNQNSMKNNIHPLYSNNSNIFSHYQYSNSNEQKNQSHNRKEIYNIYNNNNWHNINPNPINSGQKNKNVSLQDEILSPNIEDNRPYMPIPIYYDDTGYKNFYNFNINYNQRYYDNNKNNHNHKINNLNNINIYQKEKREILNINEHKSINYNKKMLILDLDETLVHSCFKPADNISNNLSRPDIFLKIKFHSKYHEVLVYKRPFVDEFLEKMSKYYNLIIFTASVQEYADPLLDQLDKNRLIKLRYYRNSCFLDKNGKFVKNLYTIYNDLKNVILLDNNPISYSYNKNNGLPIITWHFDKKDRELLKLIPILEFLSTVNDIRNYLPRFIEYDMVNFSKFNLLIDEINKEREQNINKKHRPKSSQHIITSNKVESRNESFNKNKDEKIKNDDKEIIERNKNDSFNKQNIKYNTINENSSNKEKKYVNINKSHVIKEKESEIKKNIKNLKNDLFNKQRKKEKHRKRKTNNLFNKENRKEKLYSNENKSSEYLLKDNQSNKFMIINEKHINENNNENKIQANKGNDNSINQTFVKYNPFIMNSADKGDRKHFSFFSGLKNDVDYKNQNIQINIINNIQQINLFKNDFEKNNNNIKKIDIINYLNNNSQKKQETNNNSNIKINNENKFKKDDNKRNQSYSNINDSNKINNKNKKNEINYSENYYHHTAQNFYPRDKQNFKSNEQINNHQNENFNANKINYYNNANNQFVNTKFSTFNNFGFNNNVNKEKNIKNDSNKRMQSFDDINYLYRPYNINRFGNSNYNNFYYNNNYRNINKIDNIFPIYPQNNYNHNINLEFNYNNNYLFERQMRLYY